MHGGFAAVQENTFKKPFQPALSEGRSSNKMRMAFFQHPQANEGIEKLRGWKLLRRLGIEKKWVFSRAGASPPHEKTLQKMLFNLLSPEGTI
ncbi:MAG: hypothetical protein DRI61_12160 [Chloroflexi bacterium]|nr:MAG: hypothetical protein DRI61_12160 [Chloroflexota bacterium]